MSDYLPKLWGRPAWIFLKYIAMGFPNNPSDKIKEQYANLFNSLQYTLPCQECRNNYSIHIEETPVENYLKNPLTLHEWVVIMENKVNLMIDRPLINHEKTYQQKFKHNFNLTQGKSCCNQKAKGMTEEQRRKNIEDLQRNVRARKSLFKKSKELKEKRKNKRKNN